MKISKKPIMAADDDRFDRDFMDFDEVDDEPVSDVSPEDDSLDDQIDHQSDRLMNHLQEIHHLQAHHGLR